MILIEARIEGNEPIIRVRGCPLALNASIRTAFFDTKDNSWRMPYGDLFLVKRCLGRFRYVLRDYVASQLTGGDTLLAKLRTQSLSADYIHKTEPFAHQVEGFYYGMACPNFLLADEQGLGKALSLNTRIYTPDGYKEMRDIEVGDYVFNRRGKPVKVTATYSHKDVNMYRISFSDGKSIECCEDHLWLIYDNRDYKVVDTKWFLKNDQFGHNRADGLVNNNVGHCRYSIPRCAPVRFNEREVPIHPYVLGALLGDGCFRSGSVGFTSNDAWIVERMNALLPKGHFLHSSKSMNDNSYNVVTAVGRSGNTNVVKQALVDMGLWEKDSHTKFVPDCYKYNSVEVRKEILRGLLDTDGYAMKCNLLQFTSVSKRLIDDVEFLVESLGGLANISQKKCGYGGKVTGIAYTITIRFDDPSELVALPRKAERLGPRRFKPRRNIVSVTYIGRSDAKCITVDDDESLYLAEHFIVTHNTKAAIDLAVNRKAMYGIRHCLIVCGVSALRFNWMTEVGIHSDEGAYILGQREAKKGPNAGKLRLKGGKEKLEDAKRLLDDDSELPFFIITNIESIRSISETFVRPNGKKGRRVVPSPVAEALSEAGEKGIIGMIVFDEFHRVKDPDTLQGRAILGLNARYKMAMTGTPILNTPLDLYTALAWLGVERHNFYAFRNHYCYVSGGQVTGYKNQEELRNSLVGHMLRRRKDEVLDLPEKVYIDERLEMGEAQTRVYEAIKEDIETELLNIPPSFNPLSLMVRLRQATGFTGIVSDVVAESIKLQRMLEIVEDVVSNGKKCAVFSNWTAVTSEAIRMLAPFNPASYTGELKDFEAEAEKNRFLNDPSCKVLVGTIAKMGTGLTLTAATTCIFLDEPWNRGTKEQCEDRLHRIGMTEPVNIITLMCAGTIDERVNDIVYSKGAIADYFVDGRVKREGAKQVARFLLS